MSEEFDDIIDYSPSDAVNDLVSISDALNRIYTSKESAEHRRELKKALKMAVKVYLSEAVQKLVHDIGDDSVVPIIKKTTKKKEAKGKKE